MERIGTDVKETHPVQLCSPSGMELPRESSPSVFSRKAVIFRFIEDLLYVRLPTVC